jgi:hypothetical protein
MASTNREVIGRKDNFAASQASKSYDESVPASMYQVSSLTLNII